MLAYNHLLLFGLFLLSAVQRKDGYMFNLLTISGINKHVCAWFHVLKPSL